MEERREEGRGAPSPACPPSPPAARKEGGGRPVRRGGGARSARDASLAQSGPGATASPPRLSGWSALRLREGEAESGSFRGAGKFGAGAAATGRFAPLQPPPPDGWQRVGGGGEPRAPKRLPGSAAGSRPPLCALRTESTDARPGPAVPRPASPRPRPSFQTGDAPPSGSPPAQARRGSKLGAGGGGPGGSAGPGRRSRRQEGGGGNAASERAREGGWVGVCVCLRAGGWKSPCRGLVTSHPLDPPITSGSHLIGRRQRL